MSKIRFGRLEKLAKYLARKRQKGFFMSVWSWGESGQGHCGFSGCAIGWACHKRMFKGFKLEKMGPFSSPVPTYQRHHNWDAVRAVFGLSQTQASDLFGTYASSPRDVATRIRAFARAEKQKVAA